MDKNRLLNHSGHQHTPTHTNTHQRTPTHTNAHQRTPTHTNAHQHTRRKRFLSKTVRHIGIVIIRLMLELRAKQKKHEHAI